MLTRFGRSRLRVGVGVGCAAVLALTGLVFTAPTTSAAPGDELSVVADTLVSITPARFVDTRDGEETIDGQFEGGGKRAADSEFEITIAGRNVVPADAVGVVLNVTAVAPDDRGYITLHPCVSPRPVISSLNYVTGTNTGNEVIAALSADGTICAYNLSRTHITIDVVAYVPANSEISPIVPARLLETRQGRTTADGDSNGVGRTTAGSSVKVRIAGRGDVPATGVESVFVNVTAVNARERGYVTVHACLPTVPSTSSLNYVAGVNRGNELLVELSDSGDICLFTNRSIHLTVDVVSYIAEGSTVATIVPFRLADSRPGGLTDDDDDSGFGPQVGGTEYRLQVTERAGVPADAQAAIVNLTAVAPTSRGYFTVHPCVSPRPLASSLNYTAGVNGANEIIAGLSAGGEVCIFTNTTAHFAVDIVGYLEAVVPTARPDAYSTIGNVLLEVGVAPGSSPAVTATGNVLANDDASNGALSVADFDDVTARGGAVAMNPDGTFSYTPPAGVTGVTDTFDYVVAVDGVADDSATVSITIDDLVWFVDNTSTAPTKTGTSNAPFDLLADADTASSAGETIFVFAGDNTFTGYDQGVTLAANQSLIGEASGLTIGGTVLVPPGATPKLRAFGGANTVTAGNNPTLSGLSLRINGSGTAMRFTGAGATVTDVDVTVNPGAAGTRLDGTSGTFTFTDVDIVSSGGPAFAVDGGGSSIAFNSGSITQTGTGAALDIASHTGLFNLPASSTIDATAGMGLQFDNADGTYTFPGTVTLNGGDAGIDIIGGSAGTFTFADTTITNPTGSSFVAQNLAGSARVDFNGSIDATSAVFGNLIDIDTTAVGSVINFNDTGFNSITGNGAGGIAIFDADGDIRFTTPVSIRNPSKGFLLTGVSVFGGAGTIEFGDTTIDVVDNAGYNAGVEVLGHGGTITFRNLDVTTNDTFIGAVGILIGNSNVVNILGTNTVDSTGAAALELIDVNSIDMTFASLRTADALDQAGKRNGLTIDDVGGTLAVSGASTFTNLPGQGMFVNGASGTFTFDSIAIDGVDDGLNLGVVTDSPGTFTVNGGTISNVVGDGIRLGSGAANGAVLNLSNTTFTSITGNTAQLANSTVSGSGNVAVPFSCNDLGGNTGSISFNGGADSCP